MTRKKSLGILFVAAFLATSFTFTSCTESKRISPEVALLQADLAKMEKEKSAMEEKLKTVSTEEQLALSSQIELLSSRIKRVKLRLNQNGAAPSH